MLPAWGAGEEGEASFDYMQAADQCAADEAAAQEYVAALLRDWEPAAFLPLLQEVAASAAVPQCMQVPCCCLLRMHPQQPAVQQLPCVSAVC